MIYDVYMKYTLLHNEAADLLKPPPTLTGKGTVKTPNTNKTKQNKKTTTTKQNKTKIIAIKDKQPILLLL